MTIDYDYIKRKVDEYKAEHGAIKQPPPGFVSESIAIRLTNKCRSLVAFLTEYTKLCDEANEVLDISDNQMKWLDSFATDIALLGHVEGRYALRYVGNSFRLNLIIKTIKARSKYKSVNDYLIRLYILLKGVEVFDYDTNDTEISEHNYQVLYGKLQEVKDDEQQSNTKAGVAQ